jgi:hypothetical protein
MIDAEDLRIPLGGIVYFLRLKTTVHLTARGPVMVEMQEPDWYYLNKRLKEVEAFMRAAGWEITDAL